MRDYQRVLIVGAGIAGCSAAITLARLGLDVTLVEKQEEWRFQSSGIFVYSNGLAALRDVGVLDAILAAGFSINDGKNLYFDHLGVPIVDVHYPSVDAEVPPILGIKRAEIHRVLASKLEQLGVPIRLGTTISSVTTGGKNEQASVTFSDGAREPYDLIIAADGIRSSVRALVWPDILPRKTGFGVWRSVHDRPATLDKKIMMMGVGKRLGIMPIDDSKLYIFGTVAESEDAWYLPEEWPALMRSKFAEFGDPARPFLDEVSAETEVLFTAVEEVSAPLPWHNGRILLIGDAAHASTPFMGQGGAMAIEDAVVLANTLERHTSLFDALESFGSQRYSICKFVQDASRKVGEAGAVENPEICLERNKNMKANSQDHVDQFYTTLTAMKSGASSV